MRGGVLGWGAEQPDINQERGGQLVVVRVSVPFIFFIVKLQHPLTQFLFKKCDI